MAKKFIVSGIDASSTTGVGRLMRRIAPRAQHFDFSLICKRDNQSLRNMLGKKNLLAAVMEVVARNIDYLIFYIRTSLIRNSIVLFLHPQTAGFKTLFKLIKTNKVYFYILDNSFFCLRSYNNHPVTHTECLICINNPMNALSQCMPFPVNYQKAENIEFLNKLKKVSKKVFFLAQNQNQKMLLQIHFGNDIDCAIVGLDTGEIALQDFCSPISQSNNTSYDLVYHGTAQFAKGVGYFVEIAILMPDYSCFMPVSKIAIEHVLGKKITAKNIVFNECTWETGLKNAVISAKLVVNPSLWSSPIEGALLKSVFFNGNVAVVETQFGFPQEVKGECNFLYLPLNTARAAQIIRHFLSEGIDLTKSTKACLDKFLVNNNVDDIFITMLENKVVASDLHCNK